QPELYLKVTEPRTGAIVAEVNVPVPEAGVASVLPQFERRLLAELKKLGLVGKGQAATLIDDVESNRLIIEAAGELENKDIEKAMSDTLHAIDLNPENLIPYNLLWEEIYWLVNYESEYNIDLSLDTLKSRAEYALKIDPDYYKSHYILSEYYYWTQNYRESARSLSKAIRQKPYQFMVLLGLAWNLKFHGETSFAVDKLNYQLNPFERNVALYYRN